MSGKPNDKMFKTMIHKHGSEEEAREWYRSIGKMGGKKSRGGGFTKDIECHCDAYPLAHKFSQCRGKLGGSISKRRKANNNGDE